jgi:hypothetical protein
MGVRLAKPVLDWAATEDVATALHLERDVSPRDNSYIRLSGLYQCKRQLAYRVNWFKEGREELPMGAQTLGIFDVGHAMHYHLQMRLSKHGTLGWVDADPVIAENADGKKRLDWEGNFEVSLIDHEYRVRGTLDCLTYPLLLKTVERDGQTFETYEVVPEGTEGAKRYIIDIKTCSARDTWKVNKKTGNLERKPSGFEKLEAPKPEHVTQAMMYSWMVTRPNFSTEREPKPLAVMPDVMILYVAKDVPPDYYSRYPEMYPEDKRLLHSPYKIFRVAADMVRVNTALTKVNSVWSDLDNNRLPSRDYQHRVDWPAYPCLDCGFRKECYSEEGFFKADPEDYPLRVLYRREQLLEQIDARKTADAQDGTNGGGGSSLPIG